MQNIQLGNRELGEITISVLGHTWEETPKMVGKERCKTDKRLYIEVTASTFNEISMFYHGVTQGDIAEGIYTKLNTYFDIMFVKEGNGDIIPFFEQKYPSFNNYHSSDMPEDLTYTICIN